MYGNTIFVDSRHCGVSRVESQDLPFRTLASAVAAITSDRSWVIRVRPGKYEEVISVNNTILYLDDVIVKQITCKGNSKIVNGHIHTVYNEGELALKDSTITNLHNTSSMTVKSSNITTLHNSGTAHIRDSNITKVNSIQGQVHLMGNIIDSIDKVTGTKLVLMNNIVNSHEPSNIIGGSLELHNNKFQTVSPSVARLKPGVSPRQSFVTVKNRALTVTSRIITDDYTLQDDDVHLIVDADHDITIHLSAKEDENRLLIVENRTPYSVMCGNTDISNWAILIYNQGWSAVGYNGELDTQPATPELRPTPFIESVMWSQLPN